MTSCVRCHLLLYTLATTSFQAQPSFGEDFCVPQPPEERQHLGKPAWLDAVPLETSQRQVSEELSRARKSLWCPGLGLGCAPGLVPAKANQAVSSPVMLRWQLLNKSSHGCCLCHRRQDPGDEASCLCSPMVPPMPPHGPLCLCPPAAPSSPSRGGLSPAPEAGHQLGIGGCLGLQLLLSGQVEQDFQYVGGDIK